MNIELEKRRIIEEIISVEDEWILKAIKKLLDLDISDDVDEEHQQILNERIAEYHSNPDEVLQWEEVKKEAVTF